MRPSATSSTPLTQRERRGTTNQGPHRQQGSHSTKSVKEGLFPGPNPQTPYMGKFRQFQISLKGNQDRLGVHTDTAITFILCSFTRANRVSVFWTAISQSSRVPGQRSKTSPLSVLEGHSLKHTQLPHTLEGLSLLNEDWTNSWSRRILLTSASRLSRPNMTYYGLSMAKLMKAFYCKRYMHTKTESGGGCRAGELSCCSLGYMHFLSECQLA